ncbi:RNA polymerase sigma factor [Roseococcus sp. DSY-14]|uniref:RNA polymerase sigma factor n=1 Tax=Roseococcus sp. DSY-14 TaxID=3369650 RepID=UPI00387B9480
MDDDSALLVRLRAGEHAAFAVLVRQHHGRLLRLAGIFCSVRATAEEVVQEVWLAALTGLEGFRGEVPVGAWLSGICANKARTRAVRDGRSVSLDAMEEEHVPDPARFHADGHWKEGFARWDALTPERVAGDRELLGRMGAALDALPPAQRAAIWLRDVEGLEAPAICDALGVSDANLRVLLHRGRTKLRDAAAVLVEGGRHETAPRRT